MNLYFSKYGMLVMPLCLSHREAKYAQSLSGKEPQGIFSGILSVSTASHALKAVSCSGSQSFTS